MKTSFKKIISLILALSLLLGLVISLSSCSDTLNLFSSVLDKLNGSDNDPDSPDADEDLTAQRGAFLSSVAIISKFEIEKPSFYPSSNTDTKTLAGSGVIYKLDKETGDAYIITNYHVVFYETAIGGPISQDISVYLYGLEADVYSLEATYVGGAFEYDIAVLKISGSELLKQAPVREATLGDSESLRVLDTVIAIGNAEGEGFSATKGVVSVNSEQLTLDGPDQRTDITVRVIRIDAAINKGNSGGGLFDEQGRLIGIVNAKKTGDKVDNIAYAIPINLAKALADNVIYHSDGEFCGAVKYLFGIRLAEVELGVGLDENGEIIRTARVAITAVEEGKSLDQLAEVGDTILAITLDGVTHPVTAKHHVTETMLTARPGSTATLLVERGGETHELTVTVTEDMGVTTD